MLRCVGGMLCAVLVASGCSDDGSTPVESVTTTIPSTTAASIAAVPDGSTAPPTTLAATPTTSPTTTTTAPTATVPTTTVPTATTAVSTAEAVRSSDEQQIFAAIDRYYEAMIEANDPPDPASPLFDEVAVPEFADRLRAKARENLKAKQAVRWAEDRQPWVKSPNVVWRQGSIAVVDLCLRNNGVLYDLESGEIIDDSVGYYWRQVTVSNRYGNWLVSEHRIVEEFDSEEACIASYQ